MVSLEATKKKYHGAMAKGYRAKRIKQLRWKLENDAVAKFLENEKGSVLDVPCGEGRFLKLFVGLKLHPIMGVDASEEMLKLAAKRGWLAAELENGDATKLRFASCEYDIAICIRFLDLIPEGDMRAVVRELCRIADRVVVLTIRLGPKYVAKSNTATHDEKKFLALLRQLDWRIIDRVPIFNAGWHVLKLVRREK